MIGIVVVSHSRALGESVAALARELAGGQGPRVAVAAGLDETTLGTDATAVAAAIEEVAAASVGVLVLVDIGSSVLSAEMACELVDPAVAERVRISPAPLVEGIVPAIVAAAGGAELDEVAAEAEDGLAAKRAHLGGAGRYSIDDAGQAATDITIADPHGLHARPAARLVRLVRSYEARVTVTNLDNGAGPVSASSLSKVATLNAGHGAHLRLTAAGPQAEQVLEAVRRLAASNFEDAPSSDGAIAPTSGSAGDAVRATRGSGLDTALGPAQVVRQEVDTERYQTGSAAQEQEASARAVAAVAGAIRRQQGSDPIAAGILDAHLALLDDDAVLADVSERLARGEDAPTAWRAVLHRLAADFETLNDPYQQARAADVRAIERQLLRTLVHGPEFLAEQPDAAADGAVVIVDELDIATASGLSTTVAGVVTVHGGETGHGVIVARSRGIPIFTDGGATAARVKDGEMVGFDAAARRLVIDPDPSERARLRRLLADRRHDAREAIRRATEPAVTRDGARIRTRANVTGTADAGAAAENGAEGSGLVRTEIAFGESSSRPSSAEQADVFAAIGRAFGGEPITIRTWDAGGDKPLPFLPAPQEANPMLGVRGLRLTRQAPEAFDDQLRAVCVAAARTPVRVMFPMVTTRDEVDWALERLEAARVQAGTGPIAVGIMVEVPAAAIRVAELSRGLDFVSIGTNDLTQYTLAADRGNGGVRDIADSLDPAVLQLIRRVVDDAPAHVEVAVCGDLAGRVEAVPLLLGLGVRELSVAGPVVPRVKQAIRHTSLEAGRALAERALAAGSAAEVRQLLTEVSRTGPT